MRVIVLNTGTELLLGDVLNSHLQFLAREIFSLGLRIDEQRAVPDGEQIRSAVSECFGRAEILFVTGGLGPTNDDITRDLVADLLGLEMRQDVEVLAGLQERLRVRGIKWTESIARQAGVPAGAQVLPNDLGSAPGLYFRANISPAKSSPHIFLLPGPPRELQPMFRNSVLSILRSIVPNEKKMECRKYRLVGVGESLVEEAIGANLLALGVELGYCARPGEVDLRVIAPPDLLAQADEIIRRKLRSRIFSESNELLEQVLVKLLGQRKETLATAESCTGGHLANRITNVAGSSEVFLAGYVVYSNDAKIDILHVDPKLIAEHGAVSEEVARAMAEGARARARSTYALATTGIAGPGGGSEAKPAGTVFIALAEKGASTRVKKFHFPSDRETFKELVTQTSLDLLRQKLRGA